MPTVIVNNKTYPLTDEEDMPLLWFIREQIGLPGTKFGCGIGSCGACTVHVNGKAVRSCSVPIGALQDANVTTIEGLSSKNKLHPVQQAWLDFNVAQCGYCQAGQIMAVTEFLKRFPEPSDNDIDTHLTNLCRCGTYTRMRQAIHHAATLLKQSEGDKA
ncbi:MAG: (2Fe-2S)-binding protein [Aestuariibacter sp.]